MTFKLPIVVLIALLAAVAGAGATYVIVPKTDPEITELLRRQVELAEEAKAKREAAQKAAKEFFKAPDIEPGSGQDFKPQW